MTSRRPVVAVLDTGAGAHPWLPPGIVDRYAAVDGTLIGVHDPATDPEGTGAIDDPLLGMLDTDSGHGTFIAGLIRQKCPDANILAVRVMPSDGAAAESDILNAVNLLLLRQFRAQTDSNPGLLIDVVSLSLGYYHEQPDDITFDPQLLGPLQALGDRGVAVVAAAGNDSTIRPMFPAAFTPYQGGEVTAPDTDCVPVVSVGALNPDGTVAMFSNAGDWVACHRPGVALISTFPVTFDGAMQPAIRTYLPGDGMRSTIDPDDFSCGFGTWSGTSFAAPILAGEIAQELVDDACGAMDSTDSTVCVNRAWQAVTNQLPTLQQP